MRHLRGIRPSAQVGTREGRLKGRAVPDEFQDIRLTGFDDRATVQRDGSRANFFDVHFLLSEPPSAEWGALFAAVVEAQADPRKRTTVIVGNHMVVKCPLSEVEGHQLPALKRAIAETNAQYRQQLRREHQLESARQAAEASVQREIQRLKGRLKFD